MSQKHVLIPADLVPEFEAWGKMTASLFGQLRQQSGQKPLHIPDDQAWFWTDEWQAMMKASQADVEAGRISKPFTNADDLIASLNE